MAEEHGLRLLNPVLSLQIEPTPENKPGGGKGRQNIVHDRLDKQKEKLCVQARAHYASRADMVTFGGKVGLAVRMFSDSLAPSHTPKDLFAPMHGCRFVAPLHKGYLVEADLSLFGKIVPEIRNPRSYAVQADISRVSSVEVFDDGARMCGRSIFDLWEAAPENEGGRLFVIWLMPFRDRQAREALLLAIAKQSGDHTLLPVLSRKFLSERGDGTTRETPPAAIARKSGIARAMSSTLHIFLTSRSRRFP